MYEADCIGALKLNRENVPKKVKDIKIGKRMDNCTHSNPVSVIKWDEKKM
jgi:hypothetical protein